MAVERCLVAPVVLADVVRVAGDAGGDGVPGGERDASEQSRGEQAGVGDGGRRVRSDGRGGEALDVDAGVGADVCEDAGADQRVDRVQVVALREITAVVQRRSETVQEGRAGVGGRCEQEFSEDQQPLAQCWQSVARELRLVGEPARGGHRDWRGALVAAGEMAPQPERGLRAAHGHVHPAMRAERTRAGLQQMPALDVDSVPVGERGAARYKVRPARRRRAGSRRVSHGWRVRRSDHSRGAW